MLEKEYQAALIRRLKRSLPGCVILKLDTSYQQGTPDLLILSGRRWAMLEVKRSARSAERPNQRYYQQKYDDMSFCSFIYPENEEDVIRDLQRTLQTTRRSRVS